jgi:hypothetical protein
MMDTITQWEYKTFKYSASSGFLGGKVNETALNNSLNVLGEQGWELVNVFVTHFGYGSSRDIVAVLKRKINKF